MKKRMFPEDETVALIEDYNAILQHMLFPKLKDLGVSLYFTLPELHII